MSFLRRATAAFWSAISSWTCREGTPTGGLDMADGAGGVSGPPPPDEARPAPRGAIAPSPLLLLFLLLSAIAAVQRVLEIADAGAETARQLRDPLAAEDQQQDHEDQNQLGNAEWPHDRFTPCGILDARSCQVN